MFCIRQTFESQVARRPPRSIEERHPHLGLNQASSVDRGCVLVCQVVRRGVSVCRFLKANSAIARGSVWFQA